MMRLALNIGIMASASIMEPCAQAQEIALLEAELGRRKEAADGLRQKARRLEQLAHAAGAARRTKAAAPPGRPRGVGRRRAVRP